MRRRELRTAAKRRRKSVKQTKLKRSGPAARRKARRLARRAAGKS